ncbi:MAG: isopentenyl phosphate kinase [Nitrososphaeraceae archaeon]
MKNNLALIKMGGSVATHKDRPLSANYSAIEGFSKAISLIKEVPTILVHGGGSFGHYWSVKYNMHTRPDNYDINGISIVHESMIKLNQIIAHSLIKNGLNPYPVSAFALSIGNRPLTTKIKQLYTMAQTGLLPVTYGDAIHINNGNYSILSGDVIMTMIAKTLNPSRVIFAVNTDGVYKNQESRKAIPELTRGDIINWRLFRSRTTSENVADITGGMGRKVKEALRISSRGIDVMIVNGLKAERITEAVLTGPENFEGTVIRGHNKRLEKRK